MNPFDYILRKLARRNGPLLSRVAIRSVIARLAASQSGNVAVIFAIACIPVIAAMGVAVDYTRAAQTTSEMQDALDAASLALSRRSDLSTMSQSQIDQFAESYFDANFKNSELQNLALKASYTPTGPSVTISATAKLPTDFMGIIGTKDVPIGRSSTTVWGEARLRVALALDNTQSMSSSNKMTALKSATKNLLTQLKGAGTEDGDVYVSIIPFSKDVNVGSDKSGENWVRWDLWDAANGSNNGTCTGSSSGGNGGGFGWGGGFGFAWGWGGGGGNSASTYKTQSSCENHGYTWTVSHSSWNGCITDRDQDYDQKNTAPTTSNSATLFPAEQYGSCPSQMKELSYDWTALNGVVEDMFPNGNTNQAIGLQWAWQSLTEAPFTIPPMDPSRVYKQVIILLTDGLNTQDRWYSWQSQIDARQETLCDNIKAAGIKIYTVQVNTGGDPTSTLLQNCASDPDKFFLLTSSDQIVTTFQQIGTELSDLRISE